MKKNLSTLSLIVVFLIGLALLLYPSISDWWNSFHQSRAIASYVGQAVLLDKNAYEKQWRDAREYNQSLLENPNRFFPSDGEYARYESLLNISADGVMGYIDIPKINCTLPIYHGTDASVLQIAVGHIAGTSLPVGGESSHCVLSGHRGLPSAKLFSNLDKLVEGDTFLLRVLDEILTYEVDQIHIVEPHEVSDLDIEEGKDYCTLVTCTPYGVNSHRLLVRARRIDNSVDAASVRVTADATQIEPVIVAPIVAVPMLLILLIGTLVHDKRRTEAEKRRDSHA